MYTGNPPDRVLRFELVVSGSNYRALVAHLRGQRGRSVPAARTRKEIRALIDLHAKSKTFSITRIDRHRLPQPVYIRQGSVTHRNLSRALSLQITRDVNSSTVPAEILQQLQNIIDLCPEVQTDTLRANANDFEFASASLPESYNVIALPVLSQLAPTLLLELDDQPTLVIKEPPPSIPLADIESSIQHALLSASTPTIRVKGNLVDIQRSITIPALPESCTLRFFAHWGSYEDLAPLWVDELITTVAGLPRPQHLVLNFQAHAPRYGWHGATLFAQLQGSSERIWLGQPWLSDAKFFIEQDELPTNVTTSWAFSQLRSEALRRVAAATAIPSQLPAVKEWLQQNCPEISLGELLAHAASKNGNEATTVSHIVSALTDSNASELLQSLQASYGVGEIVFASPEFSHAGAGGLAQVLTALPLELSKVGIPITIIAPLYRYQNGHRHRSAEEVLATGIAIGSERVIPTYVTTISVPLGPTRLPGTGCNRRPPSNVQFKVYQARAGNVRVFLLSARSVFDRIYQAVSPDEQLRRAILFSRGVLETIATEHLGIRPSALISNDWMTACIPSLAALDHTYREVPWLAQCKTIHMIHNGGADYHGRLPLHVQHEDLWPMFNLAPEHFFGFKDPHREDLINLTMAAVRHARGGVITVSQPYAQQLVSHCGGGDGLECVLSQRRSDVFGVSNGIKRDEIDAYLAARTNRTPQQLRDVKTLLAAKESVRAAVQQRYGLIPDPSLKLISFVGRLAEQKGLELLSGFIPGTSHSALEDILLRHPDVQILIAGPITQGDQSATSLSYCLEYLTRKYPGRICAVFEYIAHSTALEIISASELFLMPSRFEPGGISQLEALAVGTLVVGRCVGGIAATIQNFDPTTRLGTGFLCHEYSPDAFSRTTHWALSVCNDSDVYQSLVQQALTARHSWSDRAPAFAAVLQGILLGEQRVCTIPWLAPTFVLSQTASVQGPTER
jgi:starch synthase